MNIEKHIQRMKPGFILITILLLPTLLWSNNSYFFQDLDRNLALSNVAVNAICEDENGFVWFGGINGLYHHNTISIEKVNLYKDDKGASKPIKIIKLYRDRKNIMWVCTEKGLYKYLALKNKFEHIKLTNGKNNEDTAPTTITNIIQLKDETYLIHRNNQIFKYNDNNGSLLPLETNFKGNITFLHKDINEIIYLGTHDGRVYSSEDSLKSLNLLYRSSKRGTSAICKDGSKYYIGYAWLGVDIINANGVKIGEMSNKLLNENAITDDHIRDIIKRKNDEIWIATYAGIVVIHQENQTLLDSRFDNGLPHRTVFAMCTGSNDKVWVGTESGGLACYSDYNYIFNYRALDYPREQSDKSHISAFCEDSRGYIWIGSEDEGGIKVFNPTTNNFVDELSKSIDDSIRGVKAITPVGDDVIAIVKNYSNKIILYNYKKHKIERSIQLPLKADPGLRGVKLYGSKLWIHDRVWLVTYDIHTHEIEIKYECSGKINTLFFDSAHNVWIGTTEGLFVIKPGAEQAQACSLMNADIDLSKGSIYSICEAQNGAIWIGTMGQGVYVYMPDAQGIQLTLAYNPTVEADIYSLLKDQQNNIWFMTNQGLYRYSESQQRTEYYGLKDGLLQTHTRINASLCSSTGTIYLGTKFGFNSIDPSHIKKIPNETSVILAGITINNTPFLKDSIGFAHPTAFTQLESITLNANENTLGFKVVCNNYIKSQKNRFKYRLENYDDTWMDIPQNKDIVFTKVPSGKYIFEAYGANNDMVWSTTPYRLEITILPPLYRRWYAILTYLWLALALAFFIYKEIKVRVRLRKEIAEAHYKTQANEQIYSERIKLFTNISHEFRTPLSLILSPIKYILQKNTLDDDTKHMLNVAERNAKRLLKLADQSLDYRLLEIEKLQANLKKHDLIKLTKDVCLCFEQEFIDRQMKFSYVSEFQELEVVMDGDMVEKITYNLISNALKYTPEKENIVLTIAIKNLTESDYSNTIHTENNFTGKAVSITVSDTGNGIKQELLPNIFERYTKGTKSHETSTGIGLHLCKEYAILNGGNMQLINEEGKGCAFTLNLPLTETINYKMGEQKQLAKYTIKTSEIYQQPNAFSILIFEDNGELRAFLKTFLGFYYKVITASSAERDLSQLQDLAIDLIITDISMPGMSGIELTKQLKHDPKYQQIPIIVMTAYADRMYQMESILAGADTFLTKPIDEPMLLAQVNNILEKRTLNKVDTNTTKPLYDKENFLTKVEKVVERNLQNSNFEITDLLKELNISRTTLTRKLKAETQLNPSSFIRDIRLKNAVKLLGNKQFNIDEIAHYVGFNSSSYFLRSFKKVYGVSPKEYRKNIKH